MNLNQVVRQIQAENGKGYGDTVTLDVYLLEQVEEYRAACVAHDDARRTEIQEGEV